MEFEIHIADKRNVQGIIDMAAAEGWNPGLNDASCFYETDRTGFFVAVNEGKTIGCISAVKYGEKYAFIGLYIVDSNFRHKGIGLKLWNHAIESVTGRILGLDGVPAQQENYMKSGFKLEYRQIRFEAKGIEGEDSGGLENLQSIDFRKLSEYDSYGSGFKRDVFLENWINQKGIFGKVKTSDGEITGYGIIRPCIKGYKIGPLFADSYEIAEEIFLALTQSAEGKEIYLDVPEVNKEGLRLARKYRMTSVFETARMYSGGKVEIYADKVFGVTSFELG